MKVIHTADLHLDSKLNANLDREHAANRRGELLNSFRRLVAIADNEGISAILISGDLFDTNRISATAKDVVIGEITSHPNIVFIYLKGNHDSDNFINDENAPKNLKRFGDEWTTIKLSDKVYVTGEECISYGSYHSLVLDASRINIVMLHGQESAAVSKDKADIINIDALANKGIDYLALGHIHSYKEARLDGRGVYCYPGCLEGRGFDECGEKGFVILDIDEEKSTINREFVPFAQRRLWLVDTDISDCQNAVDITCKINERIKEISPKSEDLLKIELIGSIGISDDIDLAYIQKYYESDYYFVKVKDSTRLFVDYNDYALDMSLKGEFVRLVSADESLSDEDKAQVIKYGIEALSSGEVGE